MSLFITGPAADARQHLPSGYPVISSYDHRDLYSGTAQTYNIAEDDRGVIYFGNHVHGIQIWNGVRWDRVPLPNSRGAISLKWHPQEKRMYYTTDFSFGYLDVTAQNEFVPVDLEEHLGSDDIIKERFRMMRYWNGKLLFKNSTQLLSWDGSRVRLLFNSEGQLGRLQIAGGAFWFYAANQGLYRGDENGIAPFELITPDGNQNAIGVFDSAEGLTFVTQTGYLIFYDAETGAFTASDSPLSPDKSWSRVLRTRAGSFVLTDELSGLHFFHPDGTPDVHLTEAHGLPTNRKSFLFEDSSGNIWAGGGLGVSVIEYASPMRILTGEQQLPPDARSLVLHRNELFAAGAALYKWDARQNSWQTLTDLPNRIVNIRSDGSSLFAAGSAGLLQYHEGSIHHPYRTTVYEIGFSDFHEDLVFVIGSNRIRFFRRGPDGIVQQKLNEIEIDGIAYTIHEDHQGRLWAGTGNRGIYRITYTREGDQISVREVRRFDEADGLPPGNYLYTFRVNEEVFFTTSLQTYAFHEETETFHPHDAFAKPFDFHIKTPWPTVQDDFNRLWIDLTGRQLGFLDLSSEPPHAWTYLPFRRHGPYRHIHSFVAPSENVLYTISDFTAARFDLTKLGNMPRTGSAIINRVSLGTDSLLSGPAGPIHRTLETRIQHSRVQIRFNWGSTSHLPVLYRRFQTKLAGFDREWSEWSDETRREYTNLPAGEYTFRVRTRDIFERVGEEATFTISVAPPWYATLQAYLLYLLMFGLLVMALVRWRTAALEKNKEKLENTIAERTKEIEAQKQEAEKDRSLIAAQAQKLQEEQTLRSRLFANIAHEFRTPITISSGLVEKIRQENCPETEKEHSLKIIRRNIRRLSDMVDQVIDVTRLDNKVLQLNPKILRAAPLIRRIAESFRSLTDAKEQVFRIETFSDSILISADPDKFETVLNNLIYNAIKFTPKEGLITLKAGTENGEVIIRVSDTGPGIPDDQAESIFNRFHRVRNENVPYQEGMGIGLELSRSLARAMQGDLYLETSHKAGSCFVFKLSEYTGELPAEPGFPEDAILHSAPDAAGIYTFEAQNETSAIIHQILLVEDNADMQAYVSGIIKQTGNIRMASDGIEALEILKTTEPDLIISDLMMPNMDGYAFVRELEQDARLRNIPVIILTARPFIDDKLQLLRAGVVDYITKPFNAEELLLRTKNALNFYASRKEIRVSLNLNPESEAQIKGDAERAATYIREHIAVEELKTETIATALNMSRSTLIRSIKAESGMPPLQFIREIRLQYARQLLITNPKLTLDELAESVGFRKTSWFVKLFENRFGVKPGEMK